MIIDEADKLFEEGSENGFREQVILNFIFRLYQNCIYK